MIKGKVKNNHSTSHRFTLEGEYLQTKFVEEMIDHLDIESKIIVAECAEAKLQVRKFGIPPLMGKHYFFIVIIN